MKRQKYPYKLSDFNIYFSSAGRGDLIFNTRTGETVMVNGANLGHMRSGKWDYMAADCLRHLLQKGICVDSQQDEMGQLRQQIKKRKQHQDWADITLLAAPLNQHRFGENNCITAIVEYIRHLNRSALLDLIKIRFCGLSIRSLQERNALYVKLLSHLQDDHYPLISMWMSDNLLDALKVDQIPANAFFFMVDLTRYSLPRVITKKIFSALRRLVSAKKAVMLQITINETTDIYRQEETVELMARLASRLDHRFLTWGLRLKRSAAELYYLPEVCCDPDLAVEKERLQCKKMLATMGLTIAIQPKLYQFQHECPGMQKNSRTFDWKGNVFSCLRNGAILNQEDHDPTTRGDDELSEHKIKANRCGSCAFLPICMAACGRNHHPNNCAALQAVFRAQISAALHYEGFTERTPC